MNNIIKIKNMLFFVLTLFCGYILLFYSEHSATGAKMGLGFCANILIPALFPFMFFSIFIVNSGLDQIFGIMLNPITRFLFKLPGLTGSTIFLGLIGGYPTGPSAILSLLQNKKISLKQAKRMLYFVIGAGPAFVISAIGTEFLGNKSLGLILFCSLIISSILVGIITGFLEKDNDTPSPKIQFKNINLNFFNAFVKSCVQSGANMFNMCAFVILFSSFICIIKNTGFNSLFSQILNKYFFINNSVALTFIPGILEVTSGTFQAIENGVSLPILAFIIAFAGFCVHFQVFYMFSNFQISKIKFCLFRAVHASIAAIICYISLLIFKIENETFLIFKIDINKQIYEITHKNIALIFFAICFLFYINKIIMPKNKKE